MRHLKKLTCNRTLRRVLICLEAQNPIPPPLTHCIQHTYSHKEGETGEELNQREGRGATVQADCLYLQSLNSDKHLPQIPFTSKFF